MIHHPLSSDVQPCDTFSARGATTLATEKIAVERKHFYLDLQENPRGRFLKITEDVGGRRETLIVPMENGPEFVETVKRIIAAVP